MILLFKKLFISEGHIDVVCPAEVDTSTVEEEEDANNVTGTAEI